jgi:O-antigen/teichoic acid export membrane protein
VLLVGQQISYALDTPKLAQYFWLLPIGVLLSGIYNVFSFWAVRTKAFGDIARTRISQSFATIAVQILGYKLGGIALLFGQVGGQGVGSIRLARSALKHKNFNSWSWEGVKKAAKRYKQFPIFSTWSGLFNTAGTQLPPIMFAALFGASAAGLYALANRIIKLPMTVLGGAIGKVYFSNLAAAKHSSSFSAEVEKGALGLLKLSLPAAAAFMLLAPNLFSIIFGEEWRVAGEIARWMTPWILFQFISSPLSVVYFVLEKENLGLYFQIGMFIVRLLGLFLGYAYFNFIGTLVLFSLVSAVCYLVYIFSILLLSKVKLKYFVINLFVEFTLVVSAFLPVFFVYKINFYWSALLVIVILLVFYVPRFKEFHGGKRV